MCIYMEHTFAERMNGDSVSSTHDDAFSKGNKAKSWENDAVLLART